MPSRRRSGRRERRDCLTITRGEQSGGGAKRNKRGCVGCGERAGTRPSDVVTEGTRCSNMVVGEEAERKEKEGE